MLFQGPRRLDPRLHELMMAPTRRSRAAAPAAKLEAPRPAAARGPAPAMPQSPVPMSAAYLAAWERFWGKREPVVGRWADGRPWDRSMMGGGAQWRETAVAADCWARAREARLLRL